MTAKVAATNRATVTARTSCPRFWFAATSLAMTVERVELLMVVCDPKIPSMPPHAPCSSPVPLSLGKPRGVGDGRGEEDGVA